MFAKLWFAVSAHCCALYVLVVPSAFGQPASGPSGELSETTKPCFTCNKSGATKCSALTCSSGMIECPGPCLKLTKGAWVKRDVPGHTDPAERWQVKQIGGKKWFFSSRHVGEYYTLDASGQPVAHVCNVCGGSIRVKCKLCDGKGTITCPTCDGKKLVPESWTAFDNPKMKDRPSRFRLKDGRVLVGRTTTILGTTMTIRTEKGDVKVEQSEIVAEEKQKAQ